MVQLKEYCEGKTTFLSADVEHYSENEKQPPSSLPVFYNPRMQTNRDLSVLFLSAFNQKQSIDLLCEPLAGSGVRTLRYLNECEGEFKAKLFDVNPVAVDTARKNIERNGFSDRAEVKKGDAKVLLLTESRERRFDFVDVDPFGTPAPFLSAAIQSLTHRDGLLGLTATDMTVLCGVYPRVSLRKYGGLSIRAPFVHELAVRLLIGLAYNVAGMTDHAVIPLVSLSTDHYVRVWLNVDEDRTTTNNQADQIGFIKYCPKCMRSWKISLMSSESNFTKCNECDSKTRKAGPLWIGTLYDSDFLEMSHDLYQRGEFLFTTRSKKLIELMIEEHKLSDIPYIDIHELCDVHGYTPPKTQEIIDSLRDNGHQVTRTHFRPTAIRTDADIADVVDVIVEINRMRQ